MSFLTQEVIESVRVATQSNVNLTTGLDSGVVIDGITLVESDRVFVKNQSDPIENGVYSVQISGAAYRTYDAETDSHIGGLSITIREGTNDGDTIYVCTNDTPLDVVGTHGLTFQQTAGNGVDGNVNSVSSSSINNQIALFSGTSGREVKKSTMIIDNNNNMGSIGYLEFAEISEPANPANNSGRLYMKSGDDGLWWKPDAGGTAVDVTLVGRTDSFGSDYFYNESAPVSSTTSNGWVNKYSMTETYVGGEYKISWYYNWRANRTSRSFWARVQLDNTTDIGYHVQEPKDSGSDQSYIVTGFINTTLSAGSHQIDVDFSSESGSTSYIWNVRIEVFRIS